MTQITTRFIADNAVTDLKILLRNNLALRARNGANTADIEILKISNSDVLEILRDMSMAGSKITNLADPTGPLDAVNLQTLQAIASGLSDPKDAVKLATTAVLPASTYADGGGTGAGATLTADVKGAFPNVDGVGPAVNMRILVKNQVAGLENGIYILSQLGDGSNPWILTRSTDANIGSLDGNEGDPNLVSQGMYVPISEGAVNGTLGFILTTVDPIELSVTSLSFSQFGEVVQAGQGLTKTGQTLAIDEGDGLGYSGNQLIVLVDNDLVDGTTKIAGGIAVGRKTFKEVKVLTGTDISNGYIDLIKVSSRDSIILQPDGGPKQNEALDFTVNYTGGASSKTRVSFVAFLASALQTGDTLYFSYQSLDY